MFSSDGPGESFQDYSWIQEFEADFTFRILNSGITLKTSKCLLDRFTNLFSFYLKQLTNEGEINNMLRHIVNFSSPEPKLS